MAADRIIAEDHDVTSRLVKLGVSRGEMIGVVHQAVAAKAAYVLNFPLNAAGQLSYIYGTGALRDMLRPKGWQIDRAGNIESTFDPKTGIKIVFQNADSACIDDRDPRAISDKGPAAKNAVDAGQLNLFPHIEAAELEKMRKETAPLWYLFVHIDGDDIRAELSFPKRIDDGQFKGFNERIYIVKAGDWVSMTNKTHDDALPTPDVEVKVTRKSQG
jgi:hypothetical protein